MKISEGLLKKIRQLLEGEAIPSSSLTSDLAGRLLEEGVLVREFRCSRCRYRISGREAFLSVLTDIDERFRNPAFLSGERDKATLSRSQQAAETGDSKA